MELLYLTSTLPCGAMEAFFIPELKELRARGTRVRVVPMRPRGAVIHEDAAEIAASAVVEPVVSLRIVKGALAETLHAPLRAARSLALVLRSRSPRILAKNLLVFPKGLWTARLARTSGVDHIHAQWGSSSGTIGLVASLVSGVPWSFTVHRWDITEDNLLYDKAGAATFVRAISVRGRDELARRVRERRSKIRLIHMGVARPDGPLAPIRDSGELRVVTAANLLEVKGHRYLIDAIRILREGAVRVRLDVAGGGPLEGELRARVAQAGLGGAISFLGVVPHDQLLQGLQQGRWDVMVLPSIITSDGTQEGIPVSLIEAMARGVPVVSTATGAIPELLHGGAGLLVPPRDGPALAAALARLAGDVAERRRLATAGSERVREFDVVASVAEVLSLMVAETHDGSAVRQAHGQGQDGHGR